MVTVETNHVPETRLRKERVVRRGPQQMEQRLSTLKELTAAILSYSNNQVGEVEQEQLLWVYSFYICMHCISNVYVS